MRNSLWGLSLVVCFAACGGGGDGQDEGQECSASLLCKAGLVCDPVSMTCVKQGQTPDARPPDAPPQITPDGPPGAPPETTITDQPGTITNESPASFSFTSSKEGSTFLCSLDGGAFTACTSPKTFSGLADGPHTFAVKAVDVSGQQDPTPATASFTLDTAPPDTTITGGPQGPVDVSEAVFTFTCTTPPCTFQCQVDSGAFSDCDSGDTFDVTTLGSHTFRVKATDKAGNVDPTPAERTWSVTALSLQTFILTGPPGRTQSGDASFTFECRFAGAIVSCTFVCTLDGASAPCTSPKAYSELAEGSHTFQVVATTTEDHVTDPTPAERSWVIDRTPPVTTITSPTDGQITGPQVTFAYTADEEATFECDLGNGFASCDPAGFQQTLTGGSHTFAVRATDLAGNVGAAASVTWTVDADGPVVTVTSPPPVSGPGGTLNFTFTDLSPPVTFRCDFGQGFVECASGFQFANLTGGSHTVNIEGTDKWGNVSVKPFTWTVDATGPTVIVSSPQPGSVVPGTGTITWSVPTADATHFVCTIDGGAIPCSGTSVGYDLPTGDHTFEIVAFDQFENPSVDPPSVSRVTFTVDADPPVIVVGAVSGVCLPVVIPFNTSPPDDIVSYVCALDSGAFTPCQEPSFIVSTATNGAHILRIVATDTVGNQSPQTTVNFNVDTVGPLLTAGTTTGTTNTGVVVINYTSSEPIISLTGEVHIANPPDGDDVTAACAPSANALTCSFLAAENNVVFARATDSCGNPSGPSTDATGDTVVTAIAPFGPKPAPPNAYFGSDGHVVLIGHDYFTMPVSPIDQLVTRAGELAPFTHRNLGPGFPSSARQVRVLLFTDLDCNIILKPGGGGAGGPPLCEGAVESANLQAALGQGFFVRQFNDPNLLESLLPGYDVLLVADQNVRSDFGDPDLSTISSTWTPILRPFVDAGGVVVVTDGLHESDGRRPTNTSRIIGGFCIGETCFDGLLNVEFTVDIDQLNQNFDFTHGELRYVVEGPQALLSSPPFWLTQDLGVFTYFDPTGQIQIDNMPLGSVAYALGDTEQPSIAVDLLDEFNQCTFGVLPGKCPRGFNRYALVVDKLFPVYALTPDPLEGPTGTDVDGNTVTVVKATGTVTYTLGNDGQSRVDCRMLRADFVNAPDVSLDCGSDTTGSGTINYDVTSESCPTCNDGTYQIDAIAVTPSTAFAGGEAARTGGSGQSIFVDGGTGVSFIIPSGPSGFFFCTFFEPVQYQSFQCSVLDSQGNTVAGSARDCACPTPPAVCDPAFQRPQGSGCFFYDYGGLPISGDFLFRQDFVDGIGNTFLLDTPFNVPPPPGKPGGL
jgi:hypothetical protein